VPLPILLTNPTEFMLARARHMITPLILLNPLVTLGTRLRIRQNPIGRLRLIPTFITPPCQLITPHGCMRLVPAFQTEFRVTRFGIARHDYIDVGAIGFGGDGNAIAAGGGTPSGCVV